MPLNDTILDVGTNAMRAVMTHLSLHTAQPDATGSNQSTAARVAASWPASSGGDLTISNKAFTGGTANGNCTHVGFWSASTGGTFYGYQALSGDTVFDSSGAYTITSLIVNGQSV